MTSPKIIRERQDETGRAVMQHRLLSAAYSLIQQNYPVLQHSVKELGIEDGYSRIKAVKIVSSKESNETLHVYAPSGITDETVSEAVRSRIDSDREQSEVNSEKFLSALVVMDSDKTEPQKLLEVFNSDMVWSFFPEKSAMEIISGDDAGDGLLGQISSSEVIRIIDNFPHPYISKLDPLVKFSFISLSYARAGKGSMSAVLYEASSEAYAFSVGQERELIRADLSELLADMDRAGLITARGNEIYFPKNGSKFQRAFIRKYWDYVERIGKRTLFDFESPF